VRFVIVGAGAIGGVIGAQLHEGGAEVVLVARGDHFRAIRDHGLRVESPDGTRVVAVPAADDVAAAELSAGDVVVLAVKSQHTAEVLASLRAAAPPTISVVCAQNGVENERVALRSFANVYGLCVRLPASYLEPGHVRAHRAPVVGILDLGRYPSGVDQTAEELAATLRGSGFVSQALPDIMRWKYTKLLLNLGNAIEVIVGPDARGGTLFAQARAEGMACLRAAGIDFASDAEDAARRADLVPRPAGAPVGGSSWQSMARRTGNVEVDFLNGEIVLLGRLHDVPTPVNDALQRLANELARSHAAPGTLTEDDVLRLVS
jgi:2-dehydropantoate 2-reductase